MADRVYPVAIASAFRVSVLIMLMAVPRYIDEDVVGVVPSSV
jgi:hypothetical protein